MLYLDVIFEKNVSKTTVINCQQIDFSNADFTNNFRGLAPRTPACLSRGQYLRNPTVHPAAPSQLILDPPLVLRTFNVQWLFIFQIYVQYINYHLQINLR